MKAIITDTDKLHIKSTPVVDMISIQSTISSMTEYMDSNRNALGLAAIQIGEPLRLFMFRCRGSELVYFINPFIIKKEEEFINDGEACLSIPGKFFSVKRFNYVEMKDDHVGHTVFEGREAVVIQHEMDHLDGILISDKEYKAKTTGRNDLCPFCLKEGIKIKFKKCKIHNI